jgi:hypothetical protein
MSTIIMSQCWSIKGMSAPQKSVLISLADNANDEGVCWPSVGKIAMRTCLSERAVRNALRFLEAEGFLTSSQRYGRSTWYTVTPAPHAPGTSCPPAPDAAPPRHLVPPTPAPRAPRTVKEPSIEPSVVVAAAAATPDAADKIPYEQILELYNQILGGKLARCLGLSDKHRKHIRATYNLKLEGKYIVRDGGLEFWEGLFHDVLDCPFLLGQNGRAWAADLVFLTTATKIQAFMEGKYDAR